MIDQSGTPSQPSVTELTAMLKQCLSKDRHKFAMRLRQYQSMDSARQGQLVDDIVKSLSIVNLKRQQVPDIDYPPLPVSDKKADIAKAIAEHQVVIVAGETGSGKTTQLPKICLELGRGIQGLIGHTQPRRLAARTVAQRIAQELQSPLGQHVGFKIRFSDNVSENSYVKLMTDGILLAEIQQDRYLSQYDTIIIDEAHERSLNIDFILGYLKQLLPKRPDLKLIITSATIDPLRFSTHFNHAPVIEVSGRTYPVEMRYRPMSETDNDQSQAIIEAVEELDREAPGDILVFLSGEREIRDTAEALTKQQFRHTEVVPLYARLSVAEQNRVFQSHAGRRIVLATNVAETSLTVPGIKYVIDPGFARISRYSVRSKVQRLPIEPISQASANQRAGRCGRVSNGICIRLYSEEDYLNRDAFTDPEILRTNLASVILQMIALGLGEIDKFPFVQAPDSRNINDGFRLLEELGAITNNESRLQLTPIGRQLARLPVDPRYARMVVEAARLNCLSEVLVIAAGLSIQDPRERPQDKRQAADEKHSEYRSKESDFLGYVSLWQDFKQLQKELSANQLKTWCKKHFINHLRMREWQDIVSQLKKSVAELGFGISANSADYQAVHQALASGLLSHIGFKDKEREYLGARNSRFLIFPGSGLSKSLPKWTMVAELVETSNLYGRVAAKIEPEWLESLAKHLSKTEYSEPHWSKKQGVVQAFEKVTLFGLVLVSQRRRTYSHIDPVVCRDIFIRQALVNLDTKLNYAFLRHNQQVVESIESLEKKSRRRDLLVDEETLVEFYANRLPEHICSEASFKKWWQKCAGDKADSLHFDPQSLIKKDTTHIDEFSFPEVYRQGNLRLNLSYHFEPTEEDDGVSLMIPLALLNQVEDQGFDWLIPGLRHELIVGLIRSLPKRLRRNFVPAPNYADACVNELSMYDKKGQFVPFIQALSDKLKRMTGVEVGAEEWQLESLDKHLKFNFKVLDEQGQLLKQGRELSKLQHDLQAKVKQSLVQVVSPGIEQKGLTQWTFADLPKEFVEQRAGFEIKAFPGLVKQGSSVAIQLFEQAHLAQRAHLVGVRQLIILAIPSPIKYLQEKLPNKAKLGLYFNPFGQIHALIDDCINAAVDQLIKQFCEQQHSELRSQEAFKRCCDEVRQDINELVLSLTQKIEVGLTSAHSIAKKLKGNVPLTMINAHSDIKQHLDSLVYPNFVSDIGVDRINDWQRYIEGIKRRLDKLPVDPIKDKLHQLNIEKVQEEYQRRLSQIPAGREIPTALQEVRWLLEELRISFFAQQLGTSMPISVKRIQNQLSAI